MGQGPPGRGQQDGAGSNGVLLETSPQNIRCPALRGGALARPRKAEAWPAREGTKAVDPKGVDFVVLNFLGKLVSWLLRGGTGRLGASVIFHLPLLSDLTCSPGWVSSPSLLPAARSPRPGDWGGGTRLRREVEGCRGSFRRLRICSVLD